MDIEERALLRQTVHDSVASTSGAADQVDKVLEELGWLEMLGAEPADAVAVVFGVLGETNATATVLDDVLLAALGIPPTRELAVLLPAFGTSEPPGSAGLATARIRNANEVVVVGADTAARLPASALRVEAIRGIDPDAGLQTVHADVAPSSTTSIAGDAWEGALAAGRVAVAHQIAGACRTMLDLARAHALERVQFGRPIARFQAVRHRLADALVAIEALDASLGAAADEPGPMTAALAKAFAGRAARTTAVHCQQVLAGIGFTTDHPFHRYMKRTMVLDGLFGSAATITLEVGRQLLASREVPTLIEL